MIQISDIISNEKEELSKLKDKLKTSRIKLNIKSRPFKELMLIQLNKIIADRNIDKKFVITDENKEVINKLFYYGNGSDSKFKGEYREFDKEGNLLHESIYKLEKGIMLVGKNGVGKTIIIKAYCNMIALLTNKRVSYIHAKDIANALDYGYDLRPLFIDDIGKESREVNKYGTIHLPMSDLFAKRYDNGSLTFATCNYRLETLEKFYGKTTTDRMIEMFNIIEVKGESFRR